MNWGVLLSLGAAACAAVGGVVWHLRRGEQGEVPSGRPQHRISRASSLGGGIGGRIAATPSWLLPSILTQDQELNEAHVALESVIEVAHPDRTFNDIVGLDAARDFLIRDVVLPIRNPQFYPDAHPYAPILLFGPQDHRKAALTKALAGEAGLAFVSVPVEALLESEKPLEALLAVAYYNRPLLLFVSQIERLTSSEAAMAVFVKALDEAQQHQVLICVASNAPWQLDPGVVAKIQHHVYIPLPDVEARTACFMRQLKKIKNTVTPEQVARLVQVADGRSESVIKAAIIAAVAAAHHQFLAPVEGDEGTTQEITLSVHQIEATLHKTWPSANPGELTRFTQWKSTFKAI